MIFSAVNFFRGYLIIEVTGIFIERFINLAIKSNIFLWSIEKKTKNCATMKISIKGFFHIRKAVRKTKVKVKIIKRCGLPMFLHKYRKRKAFYIGFLICAAMLSALTSFVWSIEINGNERIDESLIREELKSCGISTGVLKYGHSSHKIQEEMMLKIPELSWFWVEIKGTRAIVSIKERMQKPEIFDKDSPCNLIAKCDGVIENANILNGNQVIKPGDVVKKGDLLVSGVYDTKYDGIRLLNSEGEVIAITWHSKSKTFPMQKTVTEPTGNSKTKAVINLFGMDMQIYPVGRIKYKTFTEETNEKQLKLWGDLYLPVKIKTVTVSETTETVTKMTEDEAVGYYKEQIKNEILKEVGGCEVLELSAEHYIRNNEITISVTLKCRENIAEKREIQVGG